MLDANLVSTVYRPTDDTKLPLQVPVGEWQKSVYAIRYAQPQPPLYVAPLDTVTYKRTYDLQPGDFEELSFTDFLPKPFFEGMFPDWPSGGWSSGSIITTVPAYNAVLAGDFQVRLTTTASVLPILTPDPTNNSLTWDFGTIPDPTNAGGTIEVYYTVRATTLPFADGLFLTNEGVVEHQDTHVHPVVQTDTAQIISSEPVLNITKGVVGTDNLNATLVGPPPIVTFTPPTVTFTPPTTTPTPNPRFSPIVTSASLVPAIDQNLIGVDAADLVTLAIVVENTGSSIYGAYDIKIKDSPIPPGFKIPSAGLNLGVYLGDGTPLLPGSGYLRLGPSYMSDEDFFANGLELIDPPFATHGALARGLDSLGNPVTTGDNLVIITYDLEVEANVTPCQTITNTATLMHYTNVEGGDDFTDPSPLGANDPTDGAKVIIPCPAPIKTLVGTQINNVHNTSTQAVIGEMVYYTITVTVPEGVSPNFLVVDTLPSGMASIGGNLTGWSPGISFTLNSTTPAAGGAGVTFNLGTVTNSNTNNSVPEILTFSVTAVVLDVAGNQDGTPLTNQAAVSLNGQLLPPVSAPPVYVIEPVLTVDKSYQPSSALEAGVTVTFTITVSHIAPSTTDAYDVVLQDVIPFGFSSVGSSLNNVSGPAASLSVAGTVITANWSSLLLNEVSTIEFKAVLAIGVMPCQKLTNTALVTWTSLSGNPGQISPWNTASTERTGTGVGPDDYLASGSVTVSMECPKLAKSIVATSEPSTPGNLLTIGEIVRYRLLVELPQGTSPYLVLQDILPPDLQWIDPSQVKVAVVSTNPPSLTNVPSSAWSPGNSPITPTVVFPNAHIAPNVTFDFGTLVNNDIDSDKEYIILEFNALVMNTPLNNSSDIKPNCFEMLIGNPAIPPTVFTSPCLPVVIVEPHVTVDKEKLADTATSITYQVTIKNTGTSTAFDVNVLDAPYLNAVVAQLSPNEPQSFVFTVPATPCTVVINEVLVTYSSLPGPRRALRDYGPQRRILPATAAGRLQAARSGAGRLLRPDESVEQRRGLFPERALTAITVTGLDFGNTRGIGNFFLGSICGVKFDDVDGNGVRGAGEQGVPYVRVYLDLDNSGSFSTGDPWVWTTADDLTTSNVDEGGRYCFTGLGPGQYQVREEVPGYATQTSGPSPITMQSGDVWVPQSGWVPLGPNQVERVEPSLAIGNDYEGYGELYACKFNDLNGDGVWQDGKLWLSGVQFELYVLAFAAGDLVGRAGCGWAV